MNSKRHAMSILFLVFLPIFALFSQDEKINRFYPLVVHNGYTVSYNAKTHNPNWVMYLLTQDNLIESTKRKSMGFKSDPRVAEQSSASDKAYNKSGYDKGHMCPAEDRQNEPKLMAETFYTSNICPQSPGLNRGMWKELENALRKQVKEGDEILVICGPVYFNPSKTEYLHNEIAIPSAFFKISKSLKTGDIKVYYFPNTDNVRGKLDDYLSTLDNIEQLTGNYFPNLRSEQR